MWSTKMYITNIVCFVFVFHTVFSKSVKNELITADKSQGEPFYELPCMTFGGTCAKVGNCPKGAKVTVKGLCPVQQDEGIECCTTERRQVRCRSRGGSCESRDDIECSSQFTVRDATDCANNEVCCILTK